MTVEIDPSVLWDLAWSRHREYLRTAASDRNGRQAQLHQLDLRQRLTVGLAERLIALGLRLKRRYDPQLASGHLSGNRAHEPAPPWSAVSRSA
jgi:hypothetical protein